MATRLDNVVAKVHLRTGKLEASDISVCLKGLKFRCRRCASLCCRLGGPALTKKDADRIEKMGYDAEFFSEGAYPDRFGLSSDMVGVMKNRGDEGCIFLCREDDVYECSIYDHRPALCRLYPFYVKMAGPRSVLLKFIPCCNGLNDPEGRPVDESFILRLLVDAVMDLLHAERNHEILGWNSE